MSVAARSGAEIRLTRVAKRYGAVAAVKPLDLVVEAGTLVTLLGPSGCGKTTLLRMIAGLEQTSEGTIHIGGADVTMLSAGERNVSMVFQSYALFPHMNVRQNVAYGLVSGGVARKAAREQAEAALGLVGLQGLGDRLPSELSGGQQQRVAVARALVLEPQVLLFDEPLSNFDARLRRQMRDEIRALQQRLGVTVVYVTHDQSEALAVSDKIVVMRNAEIAQQGTPRELYESPASAFVATFMGEANSIDAVFTPLSPDRGEVELAGVRVTISHNDLPAGPVKIIVRPEAILIGGSGDWPSEIAARVSAATYMGAHVEYVLDTPVGTLFAIDSDPGDLKPVGMTIGIAFSDHGILAVRA